MLTIQNVQVKYGFRALLDNVSLTVKDRDRIGLVGRNGAGKSTLLKIIASDQVPDSGQVARPNGTTLGFLHQELELPSGKTVMQEALTAFKEVKELEAKIEEMNVEMSERTDYESDGYSKLLQDFSDANERVQLLGGASMEADAERILKGLGFKDGDMNRLTDEFSGGWQMRVELAKMLLQRPDYLLLDEPTNHLDIESIIWLEKFLRNYEGVVITISHDRAFLDTVTNRTVEIELGKLFDYNAPYSKYMQLRKERKEMMESAYKNQQRVIAEKERTITRFMAKATKTKMAQSMKKQLDKMERIEISAEDTATMNLRFPPAPRSGRISVKATKIEKRYGALRVLDGVDLTLERGERVAFVGQNGQGKTTLSKILIGEEPSTGGSIDLGHNVQVGYYAQNQAETLHPDLTLLQVMENKAPEHMRTQVRSILGAFMFSGEDVEKKTKVLSGGERARLALACMLLEPFNLLVLDEPTNHLDILSKEVLKEALKQYDGTLIVVSHDREFLRGLTDKTIEFRDRQLFEHLGDVDYYLEKRQLANMREAEKSTPKAKESQAVETPMTPEEKKNRNEQRKKVQRVLKKAEKDIEKAEKRIEQIEGLMSASDFYDRDDSAKILEEYSTLKNGMEALLETWEEAQEAWEEFE